MGTIKYLVVDEIFESLELAQNFFTIKGMDGYYWKGNIEKIDTSRIRVIGVFCSQP